MGSFSRAATASFTFLPPSQWWSTLKRKNLLPQEQILFVKSRLSFARAYHLGKPGSQKSYSSL